MRRFLADRLYQVFKRLMVRYLYQEDATLSERLRAIQTAQDQAADAWRRLTLDSCAPSAIIAPSAHISEVRTILVGAGARIEQGARILSDGGVTLGAGACLEADCLILSHQPKPEGGAELAPVHIGRGASIGERAIVYPGVRIGEGSIIRAGCTVTESIPAFTLVTPQGQCPLPPRPLPPLPDLAQTQVFFVVTTGRSGSVSIAKILSQHSDILCTHEPHKQLVRLSSEYAYGEKTRAQALQELRDIYHESLHYPKPFYGESNHKSANLIPLLAELFPSAKFIWLLRDGREVVASLVGRGWYSAEEYASANPLGEWVERFMAYRLQGDKCGALSAEAWADMSPFERACWYWAYINDLIQRDLSALTPERSIRVRLEELESQKEALLRFLGLTSGQVNVVHENKAWYPVKHFKQWTPEENAHFLRWCGAGMDAWYTGWR